MRAKEIVRLLPKICVKAGQSGIFGVFFTPFKATIV